MSVIDAYLANVTEPQKGDLERIRKIVRRVVPEAEEVISYGMPGFKYKKKYLITFAVFKDHMSIFPGSAPIEELKDKLGNYKLSRGTIQFTSESPLPDSLLEEIVLICLGTIK